MSFRLRTTKKSFLGATKVFLPILLFALFLLPQVVKAQSYTTGFAEFECLFQKTNANLQCNHTVADADVEKATASGVVYKKPGTITDTGVQNIIVKIGLFTDIAKEQGESAYFYSRVADDRTNAFFLRVSYTDPKLKTTVYKFVDIPYKKGAKPSKGLVSKIINTTLDIATLGAKPLVEGIIPSPNYGVEGDTISFYRKGPSGTEVFENQTRYINVPFTNDTKNKIELPFGATASVDFWYCGGQDEDVPDTDGRWAPRKEGRVEYFTTDGTYKDYLDRKNGTGPHTDGFKTADPRCGNDAAYKIGKTIDITLPADKPAADAAAAQDLTADVNSSSYIGSVLPLCSITPFGDGSVMGCVAQILYGGVFRPVAFFAQLMGKLFDFFLGYSLSDESYRHEFVQTGWQLVRDISNIFFIIIMIWSGLMAVFNTSNVSYKKVIPTLIINALIINFSLFATRIVIDMSNITARIFYNQMVVKIDGQEQKAENSSTGYKPISEAIVSSFNPQKIFEGSVLTNEDAEQNKGKNTENDGSDFNGQSDTSQSNGGFHRYSREYAGYFTLVTLVAIAISFSVGMMFWKTAFMFVGRVVGLYVVMIFSPFAFLSRGGVPLVSKIPALNYGAWWKDLSQYALLAPIFVFFLYIINAFLNVEFFTKVGLNQNAQGFFGSVMYVMIPMLIIYGLVSRGASIAKTLAGTYGNMAQDFAQKATGLVGGAALGVASGGLAFAGTRGAGLLRLSEAKRASLAEARSRGGLSGRIASLRLGLNDRAQAGSFDVRKTKAYGGLNTILGQAGVKLNDKVSSTIGLGSDATKGGMKGVEKKEKETLKKKIESIKTDLKDPEAKEFWDKKAAILIEKEKQRLLNDTAALEAAHKDAGKKDDEITAMRAAGTLKDAAGDLAASKIKKDYGDVKNNKQLTQAMRIQFAETIGSGKTFGQSTKAKILSGLAVADAATAGSLNRAVVAGALTNPLAAPILSTMAYDSARSSKLNKDEANSYAKKAREAVNNKNKLPKGERLENEKKNIERDLDSIDQTLKDILARGIKADTANAGKTPEEIKKMAEDLFNDPEKSSAAIKSARSKMREEMSNLDIDIDLYKQQFHDAKVAQAKAETMGDATIAAQYEKAAKDLKDELKKSAILKGEILEEHKQSDPDFKQKKQADLNKKDDELEKIKEKEKKDSEAGDKKDDKK